jgi:hypothetical protein
MGSCVLSGVRGGAGIQGVNESVCQELGLFREFGVRFREPSIRFSEGGDDARGHCVLVFVKWSAYLQTLLAR